MCCRGSEERAVGPATVESWTKGLSVWESLGACTRQVRKPCLMMRDAMSHAARLTELAARHVFRCSGIS